jgi:SOS-response transcriptional repressor LexA
MTETTERQPLTPRQLDILQWINGFADTHGYAPTYRQIGHHYGWRSPGAAVTTHMTALQRKGVVTWEPGQSRTLQLTPLGKALIGGDA